MCNACEGTGTIHDYDGFGIFRIMPCACKQTDEERFIKLLERFGSDEYRNEIEDSIRTHGEFISKT